MKHSGSLWALCLAFSWIFAAEAVAGSAGHTSPLWNYYNRADFFALRAALPVQTSGETDETAFLRAATSSAFAQPAASARRLEQLLNRPLTDTALDIQTRELLMLDRRALFRYRGALDAVAPLLRGPQQNERVRSIENRARLLRAIADVEPQTVTVGNRMPIFPDSRGHIAVSINRRPVPMFIDTGANLSVLPRGIARALGLTIRPANYAVGSSVGGRVAGDVAVGDLAFADGTRVRNAIFLILPDNAVPVALLGYPVISALGSIEYSGGGIILGSGARTSGSTALALSGNDLLLRARYGGQDLLCRLDSGSGRSVFYAPFYRRFSSSLLDSSRKSLRVGGATGTYKFGTRQVPSLTITVAGRAFRLAPETVFTEPVRDVPNQALACNIGRDVLSTARDYRIDFANMTFGFGS